MWEMILAGRYMMIPISLASLVGLAVIIERFIVLSQHRVVVPEIAEAVETLSASEDMKVAYAICERRPGPFANIVRAGLDHADNDWTVIRDVLQEAGRQEATRLTRRLGVLETVAAVSPLLGLLGTVLGMIRTFAVVSATGLGNPETLSSGISEAMVTTAAGLIIGIPALVAYNWLNGRADRIIFELELYSSKVLDTLAPAADQAHESGPGMNFRAQKRGRGLILNITSLIDVMFLLVIFFTVTSTFRNQPAITLVLPRSATAAETIDTPAILYLSADGRVFLNDAPVQRTELQVILERMHAGSGDDRMVLRADEKASHGDVVDLIDTIKQSGFTRVSLSARAPGGGG